MAALLTLLLGLPATRASTLDCQVIPQVDGRCELWVASYDHPAGHGSTGAGYDYAETLAVGEDLVFVTGSSWDEGEGAQSIATVAFSQADGAQQWVARAGRGAISYPYDIAVAPAGDLVYVTGAQNYDFVSTGEILTVAYDSATGEERWSRVVGGPGMAAGHALAVNPSGTLFVTGTSGGNLSTVAYDGETGLELWRAGFDGPGHGQDQAFEAAVSPDGTSVFVAGFASTAPNDADWDFIVIAYGAADDPATPGDERGDELWSATYDGADELDVVYGLGVSPDGSRVFVTGESATEGRGVLRQNVDYATVAFDAGTGEELWSTRYAGPMRGENFPYDLAVSPTGDQVYVTGQGTGDATDLDWEVTTVAYDAATGAEAWVRRYGFPPPCVEWGQAVAATATGVYVTGVSSANCFQIDVVTLRLDPATGTPQWIARFNDSGIANDWPAAIGLSNDGSHVFVGARFSDKGLDPTSDNLDDYGVMAYDA